MQKKISAYILITALFLPHTISHALYIHVNDLTGGTQTTALNAFNEAANVWESVFADDVTINIDFNFSALPVGVLGSTNVTDVVASYSAVQASLLADITSTNDALSVSTLPGGNKLSFLTNAPDGAKIHDNDGSANNTFLDITTANAKALGLIGAHNTTTDATIAFSSAFSFDFDASNGISGFDFVGIAIHEIGHALGFISGVDIIDLTTGLGSLAPFNTNDFAIFSVLDLYRYSSSSLPLGTGVLDLATGGNPYFSIDGGTTNLGGFSTGDVNGDGRQASHWKDDLGLGIMDPTAAPGEFLQISALDLTAFDVIGWDLKLASSSGNDPFQVPLPSTLFLMLAGLILFTTIKNTHHR